MHALSSFNSTSQDSSAGMSAQQLFESLLADPRKTTLSGMKSGSSTARGDTTSTDYKPIDAPKGEDGKYIYWAPPMSKCDCGTPDEGQHIKYKSRRARITAIPTKPTAPALRKAKGVVRAAKARKAKESAKEAVSRPPTLPRT